MKNNFVKRTIALILGAATLFCLVSCSKVDEDKDFKTPKLPQTTVEVAKSGTVNLPSEFVAPIEEGKMSTGFTGSEMFGGFSLVSSSKSEYFTTSGSITLNVSAGLLRIKDKEATPIKFDAELMNIAFALFKKSGDSTIYVSTAQMPATGDTYSATFSGLDASAEYRFVITYTDVPRTRASGTFSASGITTAPAIVSEDSSSSTVQ